MLEAGPRRPRASVRGRRRVRVCAVRQAYCVCCCHTVCQAYSVYCCHTVSGLLCVYDVYTTYSCLLCAYCWHTVRQAYYVQCVYAHRCLHTQTAWVPNPHTVDQEEKVLKAQGAPGS